MTLRHKGIHAAIQTMKLENSLMTRNFDEQTTSAALALIGQYGSDAEVIAAADERGVFLSDEVMDFMLTRFSRDLGSLMELLDLMDGYALQTKRAITIPLIKAMMDEA